MKLSILIRNLNESKQLEQTLLALKRQVTDFEYEVVVIDNESDDDSVAVAERMGCKVHTLKRELFTYGRALNFGIEKCAGEIVLIMSAHVLLLNEFFLQSIPDYFNDEQVAGLRFVFATAPDKVAECIKDGPVKLVYKEEEDFAYNNWTNFIVNHCSAIKKSFWEINPFDESLPDSEDKHWSIEMLKRGYTIIYNVPCFYVYNKELRRSQKIKSNINSYYAKQLVTHREEKIFSVSYFHSMCLRFIDELRHVKVQLLLHHHIYKGLKRFNKARSK